MIKDIGLISQIMVRGMPPVCHKFKITNLIIKNVFIPMMNIFIIPKRSFQMFRHYQSMKKNISTFFSVRMIRHFYHNISFVHFNPVLPTWVIWASSKKIKTFSRTKMMFVFFNSGRPVKHFFIAIIAHCFNGFISHDCYYII